MYTKLNNRNNIWRKFAETNLISGKLLLQFFNLIQSLALKREARRVEAKEFETKQHSVFGNALFLFHTIIYLLISAMNFFLVSTLSYAVLPRTTKFIQVTNSKNTVEKSKYDIRDEFRNFPTRFNLENCKCK